MLGNVILFVISLLSICLILYLSYRAIRKANSLTEKISDLVFVIVIAVILVIYYLDRYNIPTILNLGMNINTQNWLSLIGNYITGVISAVIGALVAVCTTIYQIKKNNEENIRRDKENLKIQNLPILKYDINTEIKRTGDLSELIITNKENEVGNVYSFNIIIKNIGMNSVKNIIIDFESSVINNSIYRLLGKNNVNSMEKGETLELNKFFGLKPSDKYYEINLTLYYQDVLSNWYKQEVIVHYCATNIFINQGYRGELNFEVQKEVEIEENEIEKNIV